MAKHMLATLSKWAALGVLGVAMFGCSGTESSTQSQQAPQTKSVAITAIVEHPSLDAVRQGALQELANQGYTEGKNLTVNFQSAQGNLSTAGQIAKQFVADNPDAIIAIATPSAQAVASNTSTIPVVFSAVTDPMEAKLVAKLDGSGTNVTGASDMLPLEPQIELIKQIVPNVKTVGYVYSPGEVNSTVVLTALKEALTPMGITVIEAPAQKSSDITMATSSLVGKVDVIYTSADNNVINAYEALVRVANEAKIPLVSSVTDAVERGATAALGVNYHDLGVQTGKITARILSGEKAGSIAVYQTQELDLYLNKKSASQQGVTLPQTLIEKAKKVVE